MDEQKREYEVESIVQAKTVKSKGRARQPLTWSYYVKWKDYSNEDNTWEPPSHFKGSEHFVERFWERIDTSGRDPGDLSQFRLGEEFYPKGPPRRKKSLSSKPSRPPAVEAADSEVEVSSIIGDQVEESPATTSRGKRRRTSGVEDAEPVPPKRKRGRPPGIRPAELSEMERDTGTDVGMSTKRSTRDLTGESSRPAAAATKTVPPLPRRSALRNKAPAPSSSPDELLLQSPGKGKKRTKGAQEGSSVETPMVVPDSEEDIDVLDAPDMPAPEPVLDAPVADLTPASAPDPAPAPTPSMPAHRVRAANPRVKMLDEYNFTESDGAISTKARLMKRLASNGGDQTAVKPKVSGSKAGPGRSSNGFNVQGSRLTAEKGKLKTVKPRKARVVQAEPEENEHAEQEVLDIVMTDSQPISEPAPSGSELLQAAGAGASALELPDFEEDAQGGADVQHVSQTDDPVAPRDDPKVASTEVPPPPVLEARPITFTSRITSKWTTPATIFGLLTHPSSVKSDSDSASASGTKRYTFSLNLDPAVSVIVKLKDVQAQQAFLDQLDSRARNPIGNFYQDKHAVVLANALRAQGSYARLERGDRANGEQEKHFERFKTRLQAGELFVQMNGSQTLVMFASVNTVLCQKLEVPQRLLGLDKEVIVVHVDVADPVAYVDAVAFADKSRW